MWQNNGFGSNGQFPNGFNSQEHLPPPFRAPPDHPLTGGQYFPNQPNMIQFEDANGKGLMNNGFQPELGLYNEGAFMQNQFLNANAEVCVVESDFVSQLMPLRRKCLFMMKWFQHLIYLINYKHLADISVRASSPRRPSIKPQQSTQLLPLDLLHRLVPGQQN